VAEACEIVRQGIEPDVDDLISIGDGHTPAARPFGAARHADVAQAVPQKGKDLVAPMGGNDPKPPGLDELTQPVAVSRETEEPVLLTDGLKGNAVFRAAPVIEFRRLVELLATDAIEALIGLAIEVAIFSACPPQGVDAGNMPRIARRADEFLVGYIEQAAKALEPVGVGIDEVPHLQSRGFRRPDILQAVIVGSALEAHVMAEKPEMAGIGIGLDELESEAHMRRGIHIGDGGGDVDLVHRRFLSKAVNARETDRPMKRPPRGRSLVHSGRTKPATL
jgi:hypothetical protein